MLWRVVESSFGGKENKNGAITETDMYHKRKFLSNIILTIMIISTIIPNRFITSITLMVLATLLQTSKTDLTNQIL